MLFHGLPAVAQSPSLQIENAPDALQANIRSLVQLPDQSCDTDPSNLARFLPDIRRQIIRAGRALGYYLLSEQTEFSGSEQCWELHISVNPGEPVTIDSITVNVTTDSELFAEAIQALPIQRGDQLNHSLYERSKSETQRQSHRAGFFCRTLCQLRIAARSTAQYRPCEYPVRAWRALSVWLG